MMLRLHVESSEEDILQKLADLINNEEPELDVYIYPIEEE